MNPQAPAPALATAPAAAPTPIAQVTPQSVAATPIPQYNPQASMDAIRQFYQIPTATAAAVGTAKANAITSGQEYENQRSQMSLQVQRMQDQLDPGKYQIHNDSTGIHITDPMGKEVDVGTYANLTGANPAEVLKNSTNPKDQQFVQDYNNYQTLMQALVTKDSNKESNAVYQSFINANPGLANMTPAQVRDQFMSQYGSYFGAPQQTQQPTSSQYSPQVNPSTSQYLYERQLLNNPTDLLAQLRALAQQSGK